MKNIQKHIAMHREKISLFGVHVTDLEVPSNPNGSGEFQTLGKFRPILLKFNLGNIYICFPTGWKLEWIQILMFGLWKKSLESKKMSIEVIDVFK